MAEALLARRPAAPEQVSLQRAVQEAALLQAPVRAEPVAAELLQLRVLLVLVWEWRARPKQEPPQVQPGAWAQR